MFKSRRFWIVTAVSVLVIFSFLMGIRVTGELSADSSEYDDLKIFTEVVSVVKRNYVEDVNSRDLIYSALKGMLKDLDPHSSFLTPDDFKEMKVDTKGEFGGLGIQIGIKDGVLTIIAPIEDTPAWKVGLSAGDRILKIEKEFTQDMSLQDAVNKMRGKKGTPITITVMREGFDKPQEFTIVRDIIKVKSVKSRIVGDTIGYIKLSQFQERSAQDMKQALDSFADKNMTALILDLRNNPGGLLSSAVDVSGLFLQRGQLVVYTLDRNAQRTEFKAGGSSYYDTLPMVVLVNQGSASASEIVSGALKDWNRAVILGKTTFGKGSVQSIIPLSDGSGVRITTSKYYTPKGTSIQNTGIVPDIEVEIAVSDETKRHAVVRESDLQGHLDNEQVDGKDDPTGLHGGSDEETMVSMYELQDKDDTQLQRAMDLLKTWVIFKGREEVSATPAN